MGFQSGKRRYQIAIKEKNLPIASCATRAAGKASGMKYLGSRNSRAELAWEPGGPCGVGKAHCSYRCWCWGIVLHKHGPSLLWGTDICVCRFVPAPTLAPDPSSSAASPAAWRPLVLVQAMAVIFTPIYGKMSPSPWHWCPGAHPSWCF